MSAPPELDWRQHLPVRKGDVIPYVVAAPYDVGTHSWQIVVPQDQLIVIVKGSYDIVVDGPARLREMPNFITGERSLGDVEGASAVYPDDMAIYKAQADVVMVGHAYPPQPGAVGTRVTFSFGRAPNAFERSINVFGDRVWQRGLATAAGDPHPFESIPLVWERAFGGPELSANPVGRGYQDSALMPNLEAADTLVTTPDRKYAPACFAPVAAAWNARWSKMGSYDRRWLQTRWPYFPEDFDWSFFQAAPVEQRLDHLRGDEPFEVRGVHPEHASIRGTLAGERARAFILKRGEEALHEVALQLDTAAFDFDAMVVDLVWRGRFEVSDRDAPEVQAVFAMRERLDEHHDAEAVWQLFVETLTRSDDEDEEDEEEDGEPEAEELGEDEAAEAERERGIAEAEARADEHERRYQQALVDANLSAEALEAEPPPPNLDELAATMRASGATPAEVEAVTEAMAPDEPEGGELTAPPPLRERVIGMLHDGASFAGFDFEESDLSDLDFAGRDLTGASLQNATFKRASFAGAQLTEAQLGGGDFSEARFDGADLSGADLTEATLTRASFAEATLTAAELSDASGAQTTFAGAVGEGVFFTGGDWQGASFEDVDMTSANFSGASLGGAVFRRARLDKINLRDAQGPDVSFEQARMHAIRGDGCKLHRCSFRMVEAPRSVFENAELLEGDLSDANFNHASFLRASCLRADFSRTELVGSNLARAKLTGASFERANLMMSCLDDADLTIANLRGSNLHGAALVDTNLQDANLRGAITSKSTLVMKRVKP